MRRDHGRGLSTPRAERWTFSTSIKSMNIKIMATTPLNCGLRSTIARRP